MTEEKVIFFHYWVKVKSGRWSKSILSYCIGLMVERNHFGGKFDHVLRGIVLGWRMSLTELKKNQEH